MFSFASQKAYSFQVYSSNLCKVQSTFPTSKKSLFQLCSVNFTSNHIQKLGRWWGNISLSSGVEAQNLCGSTSSSSEKIKAKQSQSNFLLLENPNNKTVGDRSYSNSVSLALGKQLVNQNLALVLESQSFIINATLETTVNKIEILSPYKATL